MSRQLDATPTSLSSPATITELHPHFLRNVMTRLVGQEPTAAGSLERLPFAAGDTTGGTETELQAVVAGDRTRVDLPLVIEQSDYFANIAKRAAAGETPKRLITELERYLAGNRENVWENSWVRFPARSLSPFALRVFDNDLSADKKSPQAGRRSDAGRFFVTAPDGTQQLRVPVSYLLKLSLADLIGSQKLPAPLVETGKRLLGHYLNDNTSPETFSFHVVPLTRQGGMGRALARETSKRFLFTQMLAMHTNYSFGLKESGQRAMVYFAPHPPLRQKELNDHVPDAFYRDLFMSPCLSGWDRGEEKYRYMQLCHQVLSRSQLNAVAKLREAGIITNNLVVLPNVSNVSLANNGTHVSLGSRRLGNLLSDPASGFSQAHEKYLGDLAIKMAEHFLPLFVGTYSAAPYRLGYTAFHPEKALGFLPHELDYTHLRMLWRRWQKKAKISVFGQPVTPFGPPWIDRMVSGLFGLKGDFVPDFRLVDYLICLMSTPQSPALNGRVGSSDKLKRDLAEMGVFDSQMSLYLLYKLREHAVMGFSGFEGRHYSQFDSIRDDLAGATDLQMLVNALAFKYMAQGTLTHPSIPDDPTLESERRQIFFACAIGNPTFYVRRNSTNRFLLRILEKTRGVRNSRRYPGYARVKVGEYRLALLRLLRQDAGDLIEMMGLERTMADLEARLVDPERSSVAGKLTSGILAEVGGKQPLKVNADDFNRGAERYYREGLRRKHMEEALDALEEDFHALDRAACEGSGAERLLLQGAGEERGAAALLAKVRGDFLAERLDLGTLRRLMNLTLMTVQRDQAEADAALKGKTGAASKAPPLYRAR
ncbi:hypothetical protein Gbem_1868 [Citrifermentans bemidjiense Bem]|uniref:Uncharacterized protein n=1 Tax=Citrifermentans bemidjiense (strain ATCC BAA-1014 / DSM 16622 / JCM 12645 / Bem) TaxID=404380 RepID=B5EB21_CITBB|nr:hypothetical protein [Citrifermentans bemidjiense]ACH38882.1 hypothetical protein Gbem_1868 [Citrifermentans bemidjiense Bem]